MNYNLSWCPTLETCTFKHVQAVYVFLLSCSLQPCDHLLRKADLLVNLCVEFSCVFVTFPYGDPGQKWCFIVLITDRCLPLFFLYVSTIIENLQQQLSSIRIVMHRKINNNALLIDFFFLKNRILFLLIGSFYSFYIPCRTTIISLYVYRYAYDKVKYVLKL